MYEFIDVNETSEGMSLPSEALQINGEYIENQISGYRTLNVTGREALSPEVTTYETGIRDGSTLKGKRYPARIIRITYQLIAGSNEEFREAYNKLASILDVKDAELIFNDEQDKYFTGTPSLIGEVTPGRNAVVGEFEILCLDPFKYSVIEYEAVRHEGESSILIDYNGTYKSSPKLQAEFYNEDEASEDGETVTALSGSGDCGYVAFFNEEEKIIQIGDPDELDGDNAAYEKSQTLINQSFNKRASWGTAAKSLWKANSGKASSTSIEQVGSVGMEAATYTTPNPPAKSTKVLSIRSTMEAPDVDYTITVKTSERKATSVKVTVIIEAALGASSSYFGKGYRLVADFHIDGMRGSDGTTPVDSYTIPLKSADVRWEGNTAHKISRTFIVAGLTTNTTSLKGIWFMPRRTDSTGGQTGLLPSGRAYCKDAAVSIYTGPQPETYYLSPCGDYGTGSRWHGPSITRTIPADAAGVVGASSFTLMYSHRMSIGEGKNAINQIGAFEVLLVNGSGTNRKIVAGVKICKSIIGKKSASLSFYLNNAIKEVIEVDLSYNNKSFTASRYHSIAKSGKSVTFNIGGIKRTYQDPSIADVATNEVTFTFSSFTTKSALSCNGLCSVRFTKDNCTTWKDIPNKFSANDVIEADCNTGEIHLNGISTPALGALGNDWEDFCLKPGLNQIGVSYSEWVEDTYAPTFKVKYREVFL